MNEALSIEERAALWRAKRDDPDWDEHDQVALDTWLSASTSHRVAWLRMEYGWRRLGRLSALREMTQPVSRSAWQRIPLRIYGVGSAVAVLSAILIGAILFYGRSVPEQQYVTGIGRQLSVQMKDGSRIEMNTNSKIRLGADDRTVWLDDGEAYFEVTHDVKHPFTVNAGHHRILVLGTKFSVRRDGATLLVAVDSGRVRVNAIDASSDPGVVADRHVVVVADKGQPPTIAPTRTAEDELAWRYGMLVFRNSTLADVAIEFNRYNTKRLVVTPSPNLPRISGRFNARELDAFVRLLHKAYHLQVDDRGSFYEVSY